MFGLQLSARQFPEVSGLRIVNRVGDMDLDDGDGDAVAQEGNVRDATSVERELDYDLVRNGPKWKAPGPPTLAARTYSVDLYWREFSPQAVT